jgi:hypothetical protein
VTAVVLCPHPPLLFRELAGSTDPAADLRAVCRSAVADLVAGAERVVVVGGADAEVAGEHPVAPPDVRRFGTTTPREPRPDAPPLSLAVGLRLLEEAGWTGPTVLRAVPWDLDADGARDLAEDLRSPGTAVLVLGEGSTRRGQSAPGFLDERAFGFDDALADAVAGGDAPALLDLDERLAADLMVLGRAAFRVLGALGEPAPVTARLLHRGDPFGVTYLVAHWDV